MYEEFLYIIAIFVFSAIAEDGVSSLFFLWPAKPVMGEALLRKSDGISLEGVPTWFLIDGGGQRTGQSRCPYYTRPPPTMLFATTLTLSLSQFLKGIVLSSSEGDPTSSRDDGAR